MFASEIKALLQYPVVAEPDPDGIADYLTFQFCLGDKTMFRGVRKLLPGRWLTAARKRGAEIAEYWDLDYAVDDIAQRARVSRRTARIARPTQFVLQLRADVPVGAHLSGGLDSTTVVPRGGGERVAAAYVFRGVRRCAVSTRSHYAQLAARCATTVHHEIRPTPADFVELMPDIIHAMDEPAAGPGLFPQYLVSRLAREHVKVVLGGQGGDEIFGGYTRYLILYLEVVPQGRHRRHAGGRPLYRDVRVDPAESPAAARL